MLLFEGIRSYAGLASKKGIAITAAIVAAIVGASFLIWLIPQSSPGNTSIITPPRTDIEIISDVFARHNNIATDIDSKFKQWNASSANVTKQQILDEIGEARVVISELLDRLEGSSPAAEWQRSFDLYGQALDSFLKYLDRMKMAVESDDRSEDSNREIDRLKSESDDYVDDSLAAIPLSD